MSAKLPPDIFVLEKERMTEMGYEQKSPDGLGAQIDEQVCRESECLKCGKLGLVYEPWVSPRSYRAFAVCPKCGYAFEF